MLLAQLLTIAPGIRALFDMGFEPQEKLFHELTADQYAALERQGQDISKKWFAVLSDNPVVLARQAPRELTIVTEPEKAALFEAVKHLNKICEAEIAQGRLKTFEEKLKYAAKILPEPFTRDTIFAAEAKKPYLKVVK